MISSRLAKLAGIETTKTATNDTYTVNVSELHSHAMASGDQTFIKNRAIYARIERALGAGEVTNIQAKNLFDKVVIGEMTMFELEIALSNRTARK